MRAVTGLPVGRRGLLAAFAAALLLSLALAVAWSGNAQAAVSYQPIYVGNKQHYIVMQAAPGNRVFFYVEPQYVYDTPAFAYNVYEAKGKVTRKRIRANLPGMGKVDLRFKPTGKRKKAHRPFECSGKPGSRQRGTFRGTIRLRDGSGENSVSIRIKAGPKKQRLRAVLRFNHRVKCPYEDERIEDYLDTSNLLTLRASDPAGTREVVALRENYIHATDALFVATHTTTVGNLKVLRVLASGGNGATFPAATDFTSASLNPFSPFAGGATFARTGPGTGTWDGNLAGWFIAGPDTALAGAPMTANVGLWADVMGDHGGIPLAMAASPDPVGPVETLRRIAGAGRR